MNNDDVTILNLLTLVCADIHVKLLCDTDMVTIKDRSYSADEIIGQMERTVKDLHDILEKMGYDTKKSLLPNRIPDISTWRVYND